MYLNKEEQMEIIWLLLVYVEKKARARSVNKSFVLSGFYFPPVTLALLHTLYIMYLILCIYFVVCLCAIWVKTLDFAFNAFISIFFFFVNVAI